MPDPNMRRRVERLLEGEFRTDDLTRLFLYARDRCDGRESVQEIGDFVAHHEERNKGITTLAARDWFSIVRFFGPRLARRENGLDLSNLPAITPKFLAAQKRRASNEALKRNTLLKRSEATKHIDRMLSYLEVNVDGTYRFTQSLSAKEAAVLK